jgi:hypothetical protein
MYESGLGFKVFFECPGESLYYHHHMLHTRGEQLGCNNFNQVQWGISLFPFMKYLDKTKRFGQADIENLLLIEPLFLTTKAIRFQQIKPVLGGYQKQEHTLNWLFGFGVTVLKKSNNQFWNMTVVLSFF